MARPELIARVAFGSDPGYAPMWADVGAYLQSFHTSRGRQHELSGFQAGNGSAVLDNVDRRFEPEYSGSPYYPNVIETRRWQLGAVWAGVTYYVLSAFADAWKPVWPSPGDAECHVSMTDGFKVLALPKITASLPQQRSDVRIAAVLDAAGWPAADRSLSAGQSQVQAQDLDAVAALQNLQNVELTESGRLFIDGAGRLVFHDRHRPFKPPYDTSQVILGDALDAGELPYVDLEPSHDDTQIWNQIIVQRSGGAKQTAEDPTSQARHFTRTYGPKSTLQTTDTEALSAAQYWLSQYKDGKLRFKSVQLDPEGCDDLWPHVLGREIGDRVTIRRTPPGGGARIEQECIIEGIEHDVPPVTGVWRTIWRLSTADVTKYWVLGSATNGVLGVTTRLAY